jgi:hypothetical protein
MHLVNVIGKNCNDDDEFVVDSHANDASLDIDQLHSTATLASQFDTRQHEQDIVVDDDDDDDDDEDDDEEAVLAAAQHALGMRMKGLLPTLKQRILAYLFREARNSGSKYVYSGVHTHQIARHTHRERERESE